MTGQPENKSAGAKRAASAWLPAIIYMAAIFYVSAQTYLEPPPGFGTYDKLHHFVAYFGLGLVLFRASVMAPLSRSAGPYVQSLLVGALYAASDEFHQKFVPGRTACGVDWLADVAGIIVALAVVGIVRKSRTNGGR